MSEQGTKERIAELEHAVRTLTELWNKECEAHYKTQLQVIKLQKRIMGLYNE